MTERWTITEDGRGFWVSGPEGFEAGPFNSTAACESVIAAMTPADADDDLADEFAENGLYDVAEYLRANGRAATREWLPGRIEEAREDDRQYHHGEGFELGNLEVARDRLA
jgi:hypothetical protein